MHRRRVMQRCGEINLYPQSENVLSTEITKKHNLHVTAIPTHMFLIKNTKNGEYICMYIYIQHIGKADKIKYLKFYKDEL